MAQWPAGIGALWKTGECMAGGSDGEGTIKGNASVSVEPACPQAVLNGTRAACPS